MIELKNLIKYWSISLADSKLPDIADLNKDDVFIDSVGHSSLTDWIERGDIPYYEAAKMHEAVALNLWKTSKSDKKFDEFKKIHMTDSAKLDVVLCPFVFTKEIRHGVANTFGSRKVVPLAIHAMMDMHGNLSLHKDLLPKVPRSMLLPLVEERDLPANTVILGDISQYDKHIGIISAMHESSWCDIYDQIMEMFNSLVLNGKKISSNMKDHGCTLTGSYIQVRNDEPDTSDIFRRVYDYIEISLSKGESYPLLNSLLPRDLPYLCIGDADAWKHTSMHYGSMNNQYPLSVTQRYAMAVRSISKSVEGDITPVNGAPGTGKTTLLQSVVASSIVEGVLDNRKDAQFICASAATNQATFNMLDAFSEDVADARWIKDFRGYGLFMPSRIKKAEFSKSEAKKICVDKFYVEDFAEDALDSAKVAKRTSEWIGNFNRHFSKQLSGSSALDNALDIVSKKIKDSYKQAESVIELFNNYKSMKSQLKSDRELLLTKASSVEYLHTENVTCSEYIQAWHKFHMGYKETVAMMPVFDQIISKIPFLKRIYIQKLEIALNKNSDIMHIIREKQEHFIPLIVIQDEIESRTSLKETNQRISDNKLSRIQVVSATLEVV